MTSRSHVQTIISLAVLVWAAILLAQGVTLKTTYLQPYSLAVSVVLLLLLAFERWLWRFPPVARALHRPVLRGTWKGQLSSTWTDPSTGTRVEPVDVYLAVRQTYSTVSLRLMTKESISRSLAASLEAPTDDIPTLSSTYQNIPGLLIQDRSRIHHGALMLEVHGSPPRQLKGFYWTDRDTKGEFLFDSRSRKVHTSFDEAAAITDR